MVIVWDDPINLMDYVTFVFQKLFGYSREKAHQLMLDVHLKGKAIVSFVKWAITTGQNDVESLDYAKLPAPVVMKEQAVIAKIK